MSDNKTGERERIVHAAYDLFSRRGVRDVSLCEVVARAGATSATLEAHFSTKDDLVLAVLERREQRWTIDMVEAEARRRAETPEDQLLAIFDVFDEWFAGDDFDACTFINVLLEMGWDHPLGQACIAHLGNIRAVVGRMAKEADLRDTDEFAHSWHILMKGSIVSAAEGDFDAAKRAREMGRDLLERFRR